MEIFEFSAPVQSSDGLVLSELPFFDEGLTSLAPGAKIGCYWDTLDNLLPLIKEGEISSDITVTVRYKDLNLKPLEHNWDINPRLYEGIRTVDYSGMTDLVDTIERKIPDNGLGGNYMGGRCESGRYLATLKSCQLQVRLVSASH